MSKRHQKNVERQLIEIVNLAGNDNKCGECGAGYPTWASWNLGILLCGRCASVHRRVLSADVSKVKSLTLDTWSNEQIERLRRIGNRRARKRWNPKRVPFPHSDDDDLGPIEQYVRDKYLDGRFRDDAIDDGEYNDRDDYEPSTSRSRLNLALVNSRPRSRARSTGGQLPVLTHRKMTTFENSQYSAQTGKILGFGYKNRDSVVEALILADGDIETALDILDNDARVNPEGQEQAPKLPSRPSSSRPAATSVLETNPMSQLLQPPQNDWWSGTSASAPASTTATGPQIYQYTDPITGQVSYIDANGQQYLDTNNPQHQQLLAQQTNPQLIAQQTNKQNILSLYNQPTNVGDPSQLQQQQIQQQQLQQQQLHQQQLQQQQLQQQQLQQQYQQQQMYQQYPQQTGFMQQSQAFPQATGQFQYRQ